jgi:DNA end-binding protein Ku
MPPRAIWKGVIRFAGVSVPVKMYSAVIDQKIHFRLLHERDKIPVEQRMVDPDSGKPVPSDQIQRGIEVDSGEIVMITDDELEQITPEASRDINIMRFVDPGQVDYQFYERPYYLGPDGSGKSYRGLIEALRREKKTAIARWTMRKKRYIGAIGAEDGHLDLFTFRYADEVVSTASIPRPGGRDFEPIEKKMAEQLVDALSADFDPTAYQDEHRKRVMDLIHTKAKGNVYVFEKEKTRRKKPAALADTLRQSLSRLEKEKKRA